MVIPTPTEVLIRILLWPQTKGLRFFEQLLSFGTAIGIQVAGVALCYFVFLAFVTPVATFCHFVYAALLSIHGGGGNVTWWARLISIDLAIITWARILWYSPLYSALFVENKPGMASVSTSLFSNGRGTHGFRAFTGRIQTKLPWIQKPFIGFNMTEVIILDTGKDTATPTPFEVVSSDNRKGLLHFQAKLKLEPSDILQVTQRTIEEIRFDFNGVIQPELYKWCRAHPEAEVFDGIGPGKPLTVYLETEPILGGNGQYTPFERQRGIRAYDFQVLEIKRTDEFQESMETSGLFDLVTAGVKKVARGIPRSMQANVNPNLLVLKAFNMVRPSQETLADAAEIMNPPTAAIVGGTRQNRPNNNRNRGGRRTRI